jgi:hypothetical protein
LESHYHRTTLRYLDIRGTTNAGLQKWLWDFDAHLLTDEERAAFSHRALSPDRGFIVGQGISLADIGFAADLCLS